MQRVLALIAIALTVLTFGGGLLGAAWLLAVGEFDTVIAGLSCILLGTLATELVVIPARRLRKLGGRSGRGPVVLAQIWLFGAMAGWAFCAFLLYRWADMPGSVPQLLWAYSVAVSPWLLFERRNFVRTGRYFLCSTPPSSLLFYELGCAAAAGLLATSYAPQMALAAFCCVIAISLMFECVEIACPSGLQEIWETRRSAPQTSPWAVTLLVLALSTVFTIDVITPAGIDDGAGYGPLLILSLWIGGRHTLLLLATLMTCLALGAFFLVQATDIGIAGTLFNRTMSVFSIWVVYLLLTRRTLLAAALRAADGRLRATS